MELTYFPNKLHRQLESQMEALQHGLGWSQKMDGSWKDKNFIQLHDFQALTAGVPIAQPHHFRFLTLFLLTLLPVYVCFKTRAC